MKECVDVPRCYLGTMRHRSQVTMPEAMRQWSDLGLCEEFQEPESTESSGTCEGESVSLASTYPGREEKGQVTKSERHGPYMRKGQHDSPSVGLWSMICQYVSLGLPYSMNQKNSLRGLHSSSSLIPPATPSMWAKAHGESQKVTV